MKLHSFEHVPFEGLALIGAWAQNRNVQVTKTLFYEPHAKIPEPDDYDVLIVMGGPMGVYEHAKYAWLEQEIAHIEKAIAAGKKVLGICLGAQLIAIALGAEVLAHRHKEIGCLPIVWSSEALNLELFKSFPSELNVLHWHGDRFEIPQGCLRLASSAACDNQAFLYKDHVLAFQFHMEMDLAASLKIIEACKEELVDAPHVQKAEQIVKGVKNLDTERWLFSLLDCFVEKGTPLEVKGQSN